MSAGVSAGRVIYPIGTTIETPLRLGGVWELARVRQARSCGRCGATTLYQRWARRTRGGYLSEQTRCDAAGCRPQGTFTQPDGLTGEAQP